MGDTAELLYSNGIVEKDPSFDGKALILDFGSVVSTSVFERRAHIARRLGLPENSIRWPGPLDPDADPRWRDMLAGKLTEREYWAEMASAVGELVGKSWAPVDFLKAAMAEDINDDIRPEIKQLVQSAKNRGAKVGILSNELELFYGKEATASIEILREFNAIVDATHTKILKPDPRAYSDILSKLEVPASRAVFVDDQPKNVAGAKEFGIEAIYFDIGNVSASCAAIWKALAEL